MIIHYTSPNTEHGLSNSHQQLAIANVIANTISIIPFSCWEKKLLRSFFSPLLKRKEKIYK